MSGLGPIRRRFRRDPPPAGSAGLHLGALDLAELVALGTRVEAEYPTSSPVVLAANLTRLLQRQVPMRAVRPGPGGGLGRLQFADGTVVVVRGRHAGDLGRLAARLYRGGVQLAAFHVEGGQVELELSWHGHRERIRALGVDGPA